MDLFLGIGNIGIGIAMILIGFRIYNPFKNEQLYNKFGTFYKVGGIIVFVLGIIYTISCLL